MTEPVDSLQYSSAEHSEQENLASISSVVLHTAVDINKAKQLLYFGADFNLENGFPLPIAINDALQKITARGDLKGVLKYLKSEIEDEPYEKVWREQILSALEKGEELPDQIQSFPPETNPRLETVDRRRLASALLDSSIDPSQDLRKIAWLSLGVPNLDFITTKTNLYSKIDEIINWADENGRLEALIKGAFSVNTNNNELRAIMSQLTDVELPPLPTSTLKPLDVQEKVKANFPRGFDNQDTLFRAFQNKFGVNPHRISSGNLGENYYHLTQWAIHHNCVDEFLSLAPDRNPTSTPTNPNIWHRDWMDSTEITYPLTPQQRQEAFEDLLSRFPTRAVLNQRTFFKLNVNPEAISGGNNLEETALQILIQAEKWHRMVTF